MSHTIESDDSLTLDSLYLALKQAASSNQQQIQAGAKQLSDWERQPGFYSSLQSVFINASLPFEARYLAAIQIKNGIDRYWRKTAANAISKEEKTLIRSRCLEAGINEADHRLALQNAVFVAKIIRYEFPTDWPDAISSMLQYLRQAANEDGGSVHLSRALLIILYIVKELSTARLQRSRVALQNAALELFQVLGTVYVDKVHRWMGFIKNGGDNEGGAINDIDVSLLTLRVLRRLLISGFEHPNRQVEVQEFWTIIRLHFGEMLSLVTQHGHLLSIRPEIERHLLQISKLHLNMVRIHPTAFPQLPKSIEIAKAYWDLLVEFGKTFGTQSTSAPIGTDGDAEDEVPCVERLSLKGLLILRACVKMVYNPIQTFKYQHAEDKQERTESKESIKTKMLSEGMIREMMETLVTRFFVFRPKDLREWEEEPSEWERREEGEGEAWEFSIRVCAEKLFLDLVINNKDLLIQPLLQVFYAIASMYPLWASIWLTIVAPENDDLLLKDSIYGAIGLAAPVLEQHLDFDAFLSSTLVQEVQVAKPGYNILRRRIAIIIGQWTLVKNISRSIVYQVFRHILSREDKFNDLVVRVTAGRQLKNVVDNWDVQIEQFLPQAAEILGQLVSLVEEVDLSDTKMALLGTLNAIVIRMEHNVTPYTNGILSLLPPLWDQAGDEYLMKQAILGILSSLVSSMKGASQQFHSLIIPLVESSIRPDSETRQYLLEDALELWSFVVAQSDSASPELLGLTRHLFPLYELASDSLRKALDITKQYILIAPHEMLEETARFTSALKDLVSFKQRGNTNGIVMHLFDTLLQYAYDIGGPGAVQRVAEIADESNFLPRVLLGLKSAHDSHQTTGPNRIHTEIDGIIETDYWSVVARILYATPNGFPGILAASTEQPFEDAIKWVLTEWFSHCENIGNTGQKKLMCLALTKLLELGPSRLDRLQDYMTLWSDTVAECMEYNEDGEGKDSLVYGDPNAVKYEHESPEEERKRNVSGCVYTRDF